MTYKVADRPNTRIQAEGHNPKSGACNDYIITERDNDRNVLTEIAFQNGPITENVNGCQLEDLLVVCRHRLHSFQNGKFPCEENAVAIDHLTKAIEALDSRTADRIKRGVQDEQTK